MHFVDTTIVQDGHDESEFNIEAVYEYNVTETIPALIQWLSVVDDGDDYKNALVYTHLIGLYNETVA